MTVMVQDSVHQFSRQLYRLTREGYAKNEACGVMLAACTNSNPRFLVQLQSYLAKHEPELSTECYYDEPSRVLGVVLEGRSLASTHYLSLVCKEFLEHHRLLDGHLLVAAFPEAGEPEESIVSQLVAAATQTRGRSREIRIFLEQPANRSASSILLADTEETSREFIKLRLELKGYEVYEARDGSEALEKFSMFAPDVVITELNLPVLDGYQLIGRIQEETDKDGKVIVLTDKQTTKDMNRAFEMGASDYVTKPFSISELEWRIRKLQFS
ncbi:response regulator [Paenibacillus antri]|uniref:Response regulator n=1 Tax=Paenibacillus antri TaxID=2582848 RepID=A0A5R9GC45_9BACL|nr:response regulator [Paenibacillus antri]TLS52669.1 response regulator [Paenibacillus antri]